MLPPSAHHPIIILAVPLQSQSTVTMGKVSLHATFSFPSGISPDVEHVLNETNCQAALIGLPQDVEPVKPKGGDYKYTGLHDQDVLPKPKEGGDFALLIGIVNEAKKKSDELLTRIIHEQTKNESRDGRNKKKQKIGDTK